MCVNIFTVRKLRTFENQVVVCEGFNWKQTIKWLHETL